MPNTSPKQPLEERPRVVLGHVVGERTPTGSRGMAPTR
jgi:hypothetical protein